MTNGRVYHLLTVHIRLMEPFLDQHLGLNQIFQL